MVGFCRPRAASFYNPSATGSGVDLFSTMAHDNIEQESTEGTTPGASLRAIRSPSGTFHTNGPSTRGSGPGFFPGIAEGGDSVCHFGSNKINLFEGILGFCRPRPADNIRCINNNDSNMNNPSTRESGPVFFAAVEEKQEVRVADPADGTSVSVVEDERPSIVSDAVADPRETGEPKLSVEKEPAGDQIRQFVSQTLGLGCEVS